MKNSFIKSSVLVTVVLVIGYIISFIKEAVIANYYGVSADVDAYTIAITVPVTLFALVSVSIQSIVIPLYSKSLYNEGIEVANRNISNLLSVVSIIAFAFVFLCEAFAGWIIYIFAPGFDSETHGLATVLLRITAPTILFSVIERVFIGLLNVHKKYVLPSLSIYLLNLSLILAVVFLHSQFGISAACIGQLFGSILQVTFLIFLSRGVYKYKLVVSFKDDFILTTLKQSVPIIWSISIAEVNAMINRMVASFLFVGSISALGYAAKVNSVMLQFFTSAIATIVYPLYAESSAKNDIVQLNSRINFTLSIYTLFLVPLMVGVFFFKEELIEIAFARGAFDKSAIDLTKTLWGFYTIGMLFMALRETITKVFYSLNDTKTPAKNATIGVCINIILNVTLPFIWGVNGLAIATSVSAIFISSRLIIQLTRKHREINITRFLKSLPGILLSAFMMGCTIFIQRWLFPLSSIYNTLIIGLIEGAIVYFALGLLLRIPILNDVYAMIFHKKLFNT